MKKLMTLMITAALFALMTENARADFQVEGTLVSFDAKKVKLKQTNGAVLVINRSSVPSLEGYIVGKAKIRASVTGAEMLALNPEIAKMPVRKPTSVMPASIAKPAKKK